MEIKQRMHTVKKLTTLGLVTLFTLAISPALLSQNTNPAKATDSPSEIPPNEAFMINLRQADLTNFIEWVAARTGKNIIVNNNVRGKVTIYSNREVSPEEAYTIFLTVLDMNSLAAISEGSTIKIIQSASAKTSNTPFFDDRNNDKETVTAIFDLKHTEPLKISAILRPLLPIATALQTYEKTFIITGIAESITKAKKLIAILDQPADRITYDIYAVIHADSSEISKTVKSIIGKLDGPKINAGGTFFDMVVDQRTNSVLIIGDSKQRKKAMSLLQKLDTPLSNDGNTQVVYLNYIEAKEITPILKSVGEGMLKKNGDSKTSLSIESSEATNALVITGPNGLISNLKGIIAKLDIQRAQVMIEAVIVQITGDVDDDFGLIWGGSSLYDTNQDGSVAAINVFNSTDALTNIANGIDIGTPEALAAGFISNSGLTFGYLEDGNLIGAIRAISTRNKTNIMSTPTIVALDNEEASLLVGQNVPFQTGSTNLTSASPFSTVKRQDIGITLKVTPRINQGDSITLEIEQTTENVASKGDALDLVTNKTEIKTSALIRDGQVLVLGGLIKNDETQSRSQVPILGNIPLLGRLFRSNSTSKTRNNLMVFIKPTILKDQLQISGLTAQRYAFMRERQLHSNLSRFINKQDKPIMEEYDIFNQANVSDEEQIETLSH
ncbi:MAG: type II secretion system secretin GspD [Pseudomonadales bacterium]|nr:type II secretion system secretin GspD [Pseudomonadales bacterium]